MTRDRGLAALAERLRDLLPDGLPPQGQEAEIERLRAALVEAEVELVALIASGHLTLISPAATDGVSETLASVRAALAPEAEPPA